MTSYPFSLAQSARVVLALGWADFSLKYRGSVLGYAWSFLGPLVQFIVIFHVFRSVLGGSIDRYPLYLFLGIIVWEHFALTTSATIEVLHQKMGMIQQIRFPRVLLPLAVGWTHLIIFVTRLLIFLIFALLLGVRPSAVFFLLPFLLLQMTLLALGVGMAVSSFTLKYRDVAHLWGILLQILFWLTPILYAHDPVPSWAGFAALSAFIQWQPVSLVLQEARGFFLYSDALSAADLVRIVLLTILCLAVFLAGALVFVRRSRYFVQEY